VIMAQQNVKAQRKTKKNGAKQQRNQASIAVIVEYDCVLALWSERICIEVPTWAIRLELVL